MSCFGGGNGCSGGPVSLMLIESLHSCICCTCEPAFVCIGLAPSLCICVVGLSEKFHCLSVVDLVLPCLYHNFYYLFELDFDDLNCYMLLALNWISSLMLGFVTVPRSCVAANMEVLV